MLYKDVPEKTCVLCCDSIEEVRLSREFIIDLFDLIESLTHEAVAVDLLRASVCRETITRIFSPGNYPISPWFDPNSTVNLVVSIVLRPKLRVSSRRTRRVWWLTDRQRELILALLYRYGVSCASGECCGLVARIKERELIAV